jgi:hypothetical protein
MSLGDLFAQIPADFWCRAVGLDPLLYEPLDEKGSTAGPLRDLLGVFVGAVSYETRFADAIRRGDLQVAGAVLRRLPASRRAAAEQVLQGELQRLCEECTSERAKLLGFIADLERRRDLQDQDQEFLGIGREELLGLTMPGADAPNPLEQIARCRTKIREWSELANQIRESANKRWINDRKRGFELQRELLPVLEERILNRPGDSSPLDGPNPARRQAVGTVPPSMTYSVPVMDPARGEATKATRSATSRGFAGRPIGMPPSQSMTIFLPPS